MIEKEYLCSLSLRLQINEKEERKILEQINTLKYQKLLFSRTLHRYELESLSSFGRKQSDQNFYVLEDEYLVLKTLDRVAHSEVYKAVSKKTGSKCIIRVYMKEHLKHSKDESHETKKNSKNYDSTQEFVDDVEENSDMSQTPIDPIYEKFQEIIKIPDEHFVNIIDCFGQKINGKEAL
jgi:hypothetical protein